MPTLVFCPVFSGGQQDKNSDWTYEEKVRDFNSLAWISLSLKSHVPFLLAQGGGITQAP